MTSNDTNRSLMLFNTNKCLLDTLSFSLSDWNVKNIETDLTKWMWGFGWDKIVEIVAHENGKQSSFMSFKEMDVAVLKNIQVIAIFVSVSTIQ